MDVLNINVGLLGHVDSGKTSLAKCLSTTSSTACFDKSPQSQERGITIDLGFSSFRTDRVPDSLKANWKSIQFTLVDCPGHASLIKTVIGGVQIIDLMILVVDITKGIQTQTAECLIIGELMNKNMIVILNKIDLVEENKRSATIEKVKKKMKVTLSNTIFKDSPILSVTANPSGSGTPSGINELKQMLLEMTVEPSRSAEGVPMLFSVDHCFSIKGKGTVMTGTLLQGVIKINDEVEVVGTKKKVKSLERFRESISLGRAGDRLGVCLTQFDPKLLERGLACSPGTLSKMHAAIIALNPIRYYKSPINNKCKYHVTVGYETTLATLTLFSLPVKESETSLKAGAEEMESNKVDFTFDKEYQFKDILQPEEFANVRNNVFALLEPERSVPVWNGCMLIGSRLDSDLHTPSCRLVFSGNILHPFTDPDYRTSNLASLKIFKNKEKKGTVHRIVSDNEIIVANLFKKQTDMSLFLNLKVDLSTGESGTIESTFGTTGKVKIRIPDGLNRETIERFKSTDSENKQKQSSVIVVLKFKKYIYDKGKKIYQTL